MTDPDTARRERAEEWFNTNEVPTQDDDDWASNFSSHEIGWAQLIGYLAGAREEAEVWAEKLDRLQHENDAGQGHGAREEREAVVRSAIGYANACMEINPNAGNALLAFADIIERGEHREGE